MLKILFWNTGKRNLAPQVREAVAEHTPELVILAESAANVNSLSFSLSQLVVGTYNAIRTPSRTVRPLQVLSRFPRGRVSYVRESSGLTALRVTPVIGREILVCGVHLRSKLHLQESEQTQLAIRLREEVERIEESAGHRRTLLVGDFNMNPFEHGIVSSESLHAVPTKRVASRVSRKVAGRERMFFYNPMWQFFGDQDSSPGGTYYRAHSSPTCYFWNIFDQVLIRPNLLSQLSENGVQILTSVGGRAGLLTPSGIPNSKEFSDHLPLIVHLSQNRRNENAAA